MADDLGSLAIAVIGMAGRFPGAKTLAEYWENLRLGVESIVQFPQEDILKNGIDTSLVQNPRYVRAAGALDDVEQFDAAFFGLAPREAELMDPQLRLFLESAWEALEDAGHDPSRCDGAIGVYGSSGFNTYWLKNVYPSLGLDDPMEGFQAITENDKDYLTSWVSYKLNLKGPSLAVQTGCSSSLVAVHLACQSLLNRECEIALAGGVRVQVPQRVGYLYVEGGIGSPDGHCRAFDAGAKGTVGGSGVGVVVLKPLDTALRDGDYIHAVIKGSAINNDGALKVGFTAPSVAGQARVIAEAIAMAQVEPDSIGYVECHGTGTPLGDPIEIAALSQAFRTAGQQRKRCAIGSVKTNIGHLDAAAGVAGLIKTILALKHGWIPASLHFESANPEIDFEHSPFFVNPTLRPWPRDETPRRAAVSSFGIGGTNAHVILEEAPARRAFPSSKALQILPLSARSSTALDTVSKNLVDWLRSNRDVELADVAFTLQVGRHALDHRRFALGECADDTIRALAGEGTSVRMSGKTPNASPAIVFMFPGQGSQYPAMGAGLLESQAIFRRHLEECSEILGRSGGMNLLEILYQGREGQESHHLNQTEVTQPVLFAFEYALAKMWMEWGIHPEAMIGHSLGEYVAACLAGVFSLAQALSLVTNRARCMQLMPRGAMLSLPLAESEVKTLLGPEIAVAACNGPRSTVVSGPIAAVERLQQDMAGRGVNGIRLNTSHAFHSAMMAPILDLFRKEVEKVELAPPRIPFVSNVTGTWIAREEAVDPGYWVRHLRETVRFGDGVAELCKQPARVFLEVGPGRVLTSLAKQNPSCGPLRLAVPSLGDTRPGEEARQVIETLGRLWIAGAEVDWTAFAPRDGRRRVPLPSYPFERRAHWIEAPRSAPTQPARSRSLTKSDNPSSWFYQPCWSPASRSQTAAPKTARGTWLVFLDAAGVAAKLSERLVRESVRVVVVKAGARGQLATDMFAIDPLRRDDYVWLLDAVSATAGLPATIVHLGSWGAAAREGLAAADDRSRLVNFYSLLFLVQAIGARSVGAKCQIHVVGSEMCFVYGEVPSPEKAVVTGLCHVIPREYPNLSCRIVDVGVPTRADRLEPLLAELEAELTGGSDDPVVAYRGTNRLVQRFEPITLGLAARGSSLRHKGAYLITGGLGNIGLAIAAYLAETVQARLILTGRSAFPDRNAWREWRAEHGHDDSVSQKIKCLEAMEAQGAEILIAQTDVASAGQMQLLSANIKQRFGTLHGVIHAAGNVGERYLCPLHSLGTTECNWHFDPKVSGVQVLTDVLRGYQVDWVVLVSSLASVIGGVGFGAYAAANAFMDAWAQVQNALGAPVWTSVNLDGWSSAAIEPSAARTTDPDLTPKMGVDVCAKLLAAGPLGQVCVSTVDLNQRRDAIGGWRKGVLAGENRQTREWSAEHSPPRDDIERAIAGIWESLFGIAGIGAHDDFFELGGTSLLAIQVMSRLRDQFELEIPLRTLLDQPTVAGLAAALKDARDHGRSIAPLSIPRADRESYRRGSPP